MLRHTGSRQAEAVAAAVAAVGRAVLGAPRPHLHVAKGALARLRVRRVNELAEARRPRLQWEQVLGFNIAGGQCKCSGSRIRGSAGLKLLKPDGRACTGQQRRMSVQIWMVLCVTQRY